MQKNKYYIILIILGIIFGELVGKQYFKNHNIARVIVMIIGIVVILCGLYFLFRPFLIKSTFFVR